jgi:hypothetical protein
VGDPLFHPYDPHGATSLPKRPNYNSEKRRRELDKKRKKDEKRQRKIDAARAAEGLPPLPPPEDPGPPQRH